MVRLAMKVLIHVIAKAAKLFAETAFWMTERSAMMEFTTAIRFQMLAEPTVSCGTAAMVSLITLRNVTMAQATKTNPMPVARGVECPTVVMVLLMPPEEKLATMEMRPMVMVVILVAKRNVEMAVSTQVKSATTDLAIPIPNPPAAEPTANCPSVGMMSLMLARNATTDPLATLQDPTPADLIALCLNAVTVLLITCTVKSATKDPEILSLPLTDAAQDVLPMPADNRCT